MGDRTKIPWTDASWNPITGCTEVSEGCVHCYARRQHERFNPSVPFSNVTVHPKRMDQPRRWRKPRRVFVCSQGDLFHPAVMFEDLQKVMATMTMCPQHTFQLLTKRADRMHHWYAGPGHKLRAAARLDNVWLGVTAESQRRADERIPLLMTTPAAVRFVSVEPMLGPVDLDKWVFDRKATIKKLMFGGMSLNRDQAESVTDPALDWVIIGAESGPGRRRCETEWVRDLVKQCKEAKVPAFVKQLHVKGKLSKDPLEWDEDLRVQEFPDLLWWNLKVTR